MNDLPELTDIIDFIEPENEINDNTDELVETCYELIDEYIILNPTAISEPDFEECLTEDLIEILSIQIDRELTDKEEDELDEIVEYAVTHYFEIVSPRSYPDTIIISKPDIPPIQIKLDYLKSMVCISP
jgi:uncharacterized protein YgfB (UPF0149 family)